MPTAEKLQLPAERTPVLQLRAITKRFGAVQALGGVDFEVHAGEVVGLVGDNGAGKSTLIKTIAGIHPPDSGEFVFEGRRVTVTGPKDSARLGIATVYQDLALCDNLDVVANLFLGREETAGGVLDEVAMERRAREVLRALSVSIPSVRAPIALLSGGQRQCVAVARSVMWNSKVVLLDEPTAALGVVVISHNLADVFEVCDRIIVLRLGRRAAGFTVGAASREQVVAAITGAEFGPGPEETGRAGTGGGR